MHTKLPFILCADDFGLNPGISRGILKLVRMGALSAVSCMTNMPDFALYAAELLTLPSQKGLHFNLTQGSLFSNPGAPCYSLSQLLIKTHSRSIKASSIAAEFNAQLDRYIEVMGQVPDFVDGHQHVHQFPVIRQVILELYEHRLRAHGTWIRSTYPAITHPSFRFKAHILARTGGKALHKELLQREIAHNACFSGVYDFAPHRDYRSLFRQWLSSIPPNTLIMCHPGEDPEDSDVIAAARLKEMNYLSSEAFQIDSKGSLTYQELTTDDQFEL